MGSCPESHDDKSMASMGPIFINTLKTPSLCWLFMSPQPVPMAKPCWLVIPAGIGYPFAAKKFWCVPGSTGTGWLLRIFGCGDMGLARNSCLGTELTPPPDAPFIWFDERWTRSELLLEGVGPLDWPSGEPVPSWLSPVTSKARPLVGFALSYMLPEVGVSTGIWCSGASHGCVPNAAFWGTPSVDGSAGCSGLSSAFAYAVSRYAKMPEMFSGLSHRGPGDFVPEGVGWIWISERATGTDDAKWTYISWSGKGVLELRDPRRESLKVNIQLDEKRLCQLVASLQGIHGGKEESQRVGGLVVVWLALEVLDKHSR